MTVTVVVSDRIATATVTANVTVLVLPVVIVLLDSRSEGCSRRADRRWTTPETTDKNAGIGLKVRQISLPVC